MKHTGGCHCGNVRYEVEADIDRAISCNCSICSKKGHLLAFAPEGNFTLLSGETSLTDYQFGSKNIHHLFCKTCGVGSFGRGSMPDGTKMVALNVRCVDGLDTGKLHIDEIDGRNF